MSQRNKRKIYTIILANHGKQLKTICSEETEAKIYKRFNELLKESKKIAFPIQYNNLKHYMVESDYELIIIKCKQFGDKDVNKVKNNYGEYVNYETTNEDWIVVDRASYNIEETFWVYGYHPKLQRKTFDWIFDNFISASINDKYSFKSIQILHNKILIECNGKLEIVICKNKSDAIRMYNLIEQRLSKKKHKYIAFMGDIASSKLKSQWVQKIKDLTGWNAKKILRRSTRD